MNEQIKQQIIISGVGGQGVLFVTRLLAEAAINKGYPVFTSETHGMAQRGGTVVSHLKVGHFSSPLIRPHFADAMLVLNSENIIQHGIFLKPDGWMSVNSEKEPDSREVVSDSARVYYHDADQSAHKLDNPKSSNLVLLGYAFKDNEKESEAEKLFCSFDDIKDVLRSRFAQKKEILSTSIGALEAGYYDGSSPI